MLILGAVQLMESEFSPAGFLFVRSASFVHVCVGS